MFKLRVRNRNFREVHLRKSKAVNFIKIEQQLEDVPAEKYLKMNAKNNR